VADKQSIRAKLETSKLLRLIREEDSERAFRQLFDLHYDRLYRVAFFYLQQEEWAKEATLDVFTTLWQKRKEMVFPDDFRSFSYTMTKHASLNIYQREQRHLHDEVELADLNLAEDSPLLSVEQEELFARYETCLDSLPDRCRQVFILVKEEGRSYAEVAVALNISTKTVDAQLQKALKVLREALSPYRREKALYKHPLLLKLITTGLFVG